ncbi:bis(5'-nucleosyl)-tetraphosphatase (symmetrical) YqeK [Halobacillus sp. Marseille-Q1614]|uniref:bis(5'-nucleosyl)-tetraphosphatase (symmetrical) YqeK n=1 Tax=Halobacillus sp. Marseille-Q1614 TaxID=2709134 RepID=UPI00156F8A47|nr:bis(5'-nucleosyl)-tetraphosphatase (symmetrical) YqeK [Halobacillus sp. Marseille-Q1614]
MKCSREELLHFVKPHLKQSRYEHTVRVTDTAVVLAKRYGADMKKAEIAAILHDFAKHKPKELMKKWIETDRRLSKDLLHYHHELWHGPVGALMLESEIGLTDRAVQSAISCHTSGKKNMSLLDKVIFLADYIEPGRNFEGVEYVRELAEENLDTACFQAVINTIQFLISHHRTVYPDTLHAYNQLVNG